MGSVTVRHLVERNSAYYFQATPKMRGAGIFSEPLGRDKAKAITRAEYLNAQWAAARLSNPVNTAYPGTIEWLVRDYEKSDWYGVLAHKTKLQADQHLAVVVSALGKVQVAAITRRHCRRLYDVLVRNKSRPYANKSIKWLRRILSYSIEIGLRETNPAMKMGLKGDGRRRTVWTIGEIEAFKSTAISQNRRSWALAVQIAYDTSQRLSDVLAVTWNDFDGEGLSFRQQKTGQDVWTPLSPETHKMLAETERRAIQIITGDIQGKPIKHASFFGRVFRELRAKTDMRQELTFHDLRRTAATEIYSGGGNVEPITGHMPGSNVLKNYIVPNKDAARAAQRARTKGDKKFER
ncbi:MAG: tyrosine-type recombinase/integrase [Proteobacteria bacterium]|nr:tyrosine-type recombinase/integrase [Pseudomonadota bacterium]